MKNVLTIGIILLIFSSVVHLHAQWIKLYGGVDSDTAYLIQAKKNNNECIAIFPLVSVQS